jgi:protein-disulfide isomerase
MSDLEAGVDHVRGPAASPVVVEYGDYECPYSRLAFRAIERVERLRAGGIRFAFRHFPLTEIHPHALSAAAAVEAAALQGRFWEMHELLFHCQHALQYDAVTAYAAELGLEPAQFERDRVGNEALARVARDAASAEASREVNQTPTLFIDGVVHRGAFDAGTLLSALPR